MDVEAPADRPRVAELQGHAVDAGDDRALARAPPAGGAARAQDLHREQAPGPGPEVLGREVPLRRVAQVGVHVRRPYRAPPPALAEILEELLAGELLRAAHDAGHARVVQLDRLLLAALAAEAQPQRGAREARVPVAQGRQAVRVVLSRVLLVADARAARFQETHERGEDLLARQAPAPQVRAHPPPDGRQRPGEGGETVELRRVAQLAPARVVAVLLAPPRVAARGLDVAARVGGDPDLAPGGRDGQRADARQRARIAKGRAARVAVGEGAAAAEAGDAGVRIARVVQLRGGRGSCGRAGT